MHREQKNLEYRMGYTSIKAGYFRATVHILSNNRNWLIDMPGTMSLCAGSSRTRGSIHKGVTALLYKGDKRTLQPTKVMTPPYKRC